jgi:hypothetical protein
MSKELQVLLDAARKIAMTSDEREQQRRSFAYGNTNIENERITKETINKAAESLAGDDSD